MLPVKNNDSDSDGDALSVVAVDTRVRAVLLASMTTVRPVIQPMTSSPTLQLRDSAARKMFSYTLSDGVLNNQATVTVTVQPAVLMWRP